LAQFQAVCLSRRSPPRRKTRPGSLGGGREPALALRLTPLNRSTV